MLTREGSVATPGEALLFVADVASLSRLLLHHDAQLNVREWVTACRGSRSGFGKMSGRTDDGVEIGTTGV